MKTNKCLQLFLILSFFLFSNFFLFSSVTSPKYVFFFIGDGMGIPHVNLAESYLAAINDKVGVEKLTFTRFPVFGLSTTYAENRYITCSAAAGTALSTGSKTSINTIGLASDHHDTLFSIAYRAKQKGKKIGIISSVGINHATPAAFYAHQVSRNHYYEIALQATKSDFDVVACGGFIQPKGVNNDFKSAYDIAKENGYQVLNTNESIQNYNRKNEKVMFVSPNTLENNSMPYAIDRKNNSYSLHNFLEKSISILDNENGFFIMLESGKIDWAAHNNDAATVVHEVIDFDKSIKIAYDFYLQHPEETLIIITADHETGGLGLGYDKNGYESNFSNLQFQKKSFETINQEVFQKYKTTNNISYQDFLSIGEEYFNISKTELSPSELQELETVYTSFNSSRSSNANISIEEINVFIKTYLDIFNHRASVAWTTHFHTGTPVGVWAIGYKSNEFTGNYDNTDIPKKLAKIMQLMP